MPAVVDTRETLATRRRNFTRNEVARCAMSLFDRDGYDAVTVDDIAAAAGISVRTFFRYFPAKEDVVLHEHDVAHHRLIRALERRPATEGPVTALRHAFIDSATVLPADRELTLQYGRVRAQSPSLSARSDGVTMIANRSVIAAVAARMGVDAAENTAPETIVVAMSAVASSAFRRWVETGGAGSPAPIIGESLDLLIRGLSSLDTGPLVARPRRTARKEPQ
jgi:AcrR family transcriptional regulator